MGDNGDHWLGHVRDRRDSFFEHRVISVVVAKTNGSRGKVQENRLASLDQDRLADPIVITGGDAQPALCVVSDHLGVKCALTKLAKKSLDLRWQVGSPTRYFGLVM